MNATAPQRSLIATLSAAVSERLHLDRRHARARVQAFSVFVIAPLLGLFLVTMALANMAIGKATMAFAWPGYLAILVTFGAPVVAWIRRNPEGASIGYNALFMACIGSIHLFVGGPAGVFTPLILLPVSVVFMSHGPKIGGRFFVAAFAILLVLLISTVTGFTQPVAWPAELRAVGYSLSLIFVLATGFWTGAIGDAIFKAQADAIRSAGERARAADEAKSRFLAEISHELRTPLTGLLGLLEIAERDASLDPSTSRLIATARSSGASLERTVNDLLDLDALEAGRLSLRPEPASLCAILEDLRSLYIEKAVRDGVTLSIRWPDDRAGLATPRLVDASRIRQAVGNFITNAIRYAPGGAVTIWVAPVGADRVRISVENDGSDVSPSLVNRLFERHSHDSTGKGRAGLGLAISRGLARAMGGDTYYMPRPDGGSVFGLEIEAPASRLAVPEAAPQEPAPTAVNAGASIRVLIADDHVVNREVLSRMSNALGGKVVAVENGLEAVHAAGKTAYDLLLLDIRMPKCSGDEAIRQIRKLDGYQTVTAFAVTANASEEQRASYLAAGFDGVIAKPFSITQIAEAFGVAAQGLEQRQTARRARS